MTPKQLIEYYGSDVQRAAYCIGYTPQAVQHWITQDRIPYKAQRLIEATTGGKLKAKKGKK